VVDAPPLAGPGVWGTCPTCGDATPPGARTCPTCGKERPAGTPAVPTEPKLIRRLKLHRGLRVFLVVAVVVGLIGAMGLALEQGPPAAPDPLTNTWVYTVAPGNYSVFSGNITGGDYISGNFTIVNPPGAVVHFVVYNASGYARFQAGEPAIPQQQPVNASSGLIIFSPIVTDTYFFVWEDQYPPPSHVALTLYAKTQYLSNVNVQ
jgi:hypothetical protein